jgi:predicted RNA-binding protein
MCQAKILMEGSDGEAPYMEDVIRMRVEGETVWLKRFFEEPVQVQAKVVEADFLKHTVTLRRTDKD